MEYIGGIIHLLTIDPNFLGHPSGKQCVILEPVFRFEEKKGEILELDHGPWFPPQSGLKKPSAA